MFGPKCRWKLERSTLSSMVYEGQNPKQYAMAASHDENVTAINSGALPAKAREEAWAMFQPGDPVFADWSDPFTTEGGAPQVEMHTVGDYIKSTITDFYQGAGGDYIMVASHETQGLTGRVMQVYHYLCTPADMKTVAFLAGGLGVVAFFLGRSLK